MKARQSRFVEKARLQFSQVVDRGLHSSAHPVPDQKGIVMTDRFTHFCILLVLPDFRDPRQPRRCKAHLAIVSRSPDAELIERVWLNTQTQ